MSGHVFLKRIKGVLHRERILIVSSRKEFIAFCKVVLGRDFDLLYANAEEISFVCPEFFFVLAVLIDGSSFSGGESDFVFDFFKNTLERPVFVCFKESDCLKYVYGLLNRKNQELSVSCGEISSAQGADEKFCAENGLNPGFCEQIEIACKSDSIVLLLGESGSGKNHTARLIHENSARKNRKFTSLNLAEINQNLIESSLFGSMKGSFTGAEESAGIFEEAADGTLFIDEICELSLESQGKFLGVLDSREFSRVGSTKKIRLDARLIFATDSKISELVEQNLFKRQLFYRISVLVINVPPLRERKDELVKLADSFASLFGKKLSSCAIKKLKDFSWPGNIRQLKNCIERSAVSSKNEILFADDIIFF